MKSLWPIATVALLALATFTALSTTAMEEEHAFVVLLTDPADDQGTGAGGYYDILEVAVAERGDETLVFKTTVTDATDFVSIGGVRSLGSLRLDFSVNDAADYQITIDTAGASPGDDHAESCSVEGDSFLCIVKYSAITAKVGDKVTGLSAKSKVLNDADTATGDEYTLAGTTAIDADDGSETTTEVLAGEEAEIKANHTTVKNGTTIYTWNNTLPSVTLVYDVTVGSGGVGIQVEVNNTTLLEAAIAESGNGTLPVEDAPRGEWTITLTYSGFTGELTLAVEALDVAADVPGTTAKTADATNGTDLDEKETKDSPGLALVPALGALALIVFVARRRFA